MLSAGSSDTIALSPSTFAPRPIDTANTSTHLSLRDLDALIARWMSSVFPLHINTRAWKSKVKNNNLTITLKMTSTQVILTMTSTQLNTISQRRQTCHINLCWSNPYSTEVVETPDTTNKSPWDYTNSDDHPTARNHKHWLIWVQAFYCIKTFSSVYHHFWSSR